MKLKTMRLFCFFSLCLAPTILFSNFTNLHASNPKDKPVKSVASKSWQEYISNDPNNVLLDFSYAGYMKGEVAPPDVNTLGYKLYDITDYGAVPNDGKSDRKAFFRLLEDMGAIRGKEKGVVAYHLDRSAKGIIYFPEGEFILQGEEDEDKSQAIRLNFGDFIIKGAGRNKTTLKMDVENLPSDPKKLWTCPVLLEVRHPKGLNELAVVTKDAPRGSFTIEVSTAQKVKAGDWICLKLENNDPELVSREMAPYKPLPTMTNIIEKGVQIYDYHQVKSVKGTTITFEEPLMYAVEAKWNWKLMRFNHFENVGVEDICFEGKAKSHFVHHGSAADDGGYKLIDFVRLTNSWMRRVNFVSVSEASSIISSANVSVYDVEISGTRGHSAVRSQASSRVFIGKVRDSSVANDPLDSSGQAVIENAGQHHTVGVSKQSLGAVIWNSHWGDDSCFESHATQPRATLIDHCKGGFLPMRQGGAENQLPNHMSDLTIWNMNATRVEYEKNWNKGFIWWDVTSKWWRNLPPTIVGFHGEPIDFGDVEHQMKRLESNGVKVEPASLYEAQINKRLGYTPQWLLDLK